MATSPTPFFKHPQAVGMTYMEHARFSLGLAWTLALGAGASVVHAIWPDVLESYTSTTIENLEKRIRMTRGNSTEGT